MSRFSGEQKKMNVCGASMALVVSQVCFFFTMKIEASCIDTVIEWAIIPAAIVRIVSLLQISIFSL